MKRLFIGLITSLLVIGIASAEPVKRVDGRRVETYKRVTVDTIRGNASATNDGIKIDPDRDGTIEVTIDDDGALTADGLVTGKAGLVMVWIKVKMFRWQLKRQLIRLRKICLPCR